jgi:hypothetical protein
MITKELVDYIRSSLASGKTQESISQTLISQGWLFVDIQEGFRIINQPNLPNEVPVIKKKKHTIIKIIFLIFMFLIGLGIARVFTFTQNIYLSFKQGDLSSIISNNESFKFLFDLLSKYNK